MEAHVKLGPGEAEVTYTDTPVTTVPQVCPICLQLIRTESTVSDVLEFADFPGVVYHVACAESVGIDRVRAILAENWPPPPLPAEIAAQAAGDAADEATDTPEPDAAEAVADDEQE